MYFRYHGLGGTDGLCSSVAAVSCCVLADVVCVDVSFGINVAVCVVLREVVSLIEDSVIVEEGGEEGGDEGGEDKEELESVSVEVFDCVLTRCCCNCCGCGEVSSGKLSSRKVRTAFQVCTLDSELEGFKVSVTSVRCLAARAKVSSALLPLECSALVPVSSCLLEESECSRFAALCHVVALTSLSSALELGGLSASVLNNYSECCCYLLNTPYSFPTLWILSLHKPHPVLVVPFKYLNKIFLCDFCMSPSSC
jgi:hypothetical protein